MAFDSSQWFLTKVCPREFELFIFDFKEFSLLSSTSLHSPWVVNELSTCALPEHSFGGFLRLRFYIGMTPHYHFNHTTIVFNNAYFLLYSDIHLLSRIAAYHLFSQDHNCRSLNSRTKFRRNYSCRSAFFASMPFMRI